MIRFTVKLRVIRVQTSIDIFIGMSSNGKMFPCTQDLEQEWELTTDSSM